MASSLVLNGSNYIETLPDGPWHLATVKIDDVEIMVALCPLHPPRFYRDGKPFEIEWHPHG